MNKHEYTDQNIAEGRPADYMCGCPKGELLGPCEHAAAVGCPHPAPCVDVTCDGFDLYADRVPLPGTIG